MRANRGERALVAAFLLALGMAGCVAVAAPVSPVPAMGEPDVAADTPVATTEPSVETVVLLHGLGRTHRSMQAMERSLETRYRVVNLGYPSRHHGVAALADTLAAELEACCASHPGPLHFVTHSLGGILVRAYGDAHGLERIGRVVMLSPPNNGSEVVDRLPDGLLALLVGPAALELGTDSASLVHDLPPADFELGVIAGDRSLNPLFSLWLPGDDDGKVTAESTRVEGAEDFLVVPYSHTWIMRREEVIEQVLSFLETGRFAEPSPSGGAR